MELVQYVNVKWIPYHHMTRPQAVDRGDAVQIWKVAVKTWAAGKGRTTSLGGLEGANNSLPLKAARYEVTPCLGLGGLL
jgi:hypothetical protein